MGNGWKHSLDQSDIMRQGKQAKLKTQDKDYHNKTGNAQQAQRHGLDTEQKEHGAQGQERHND